MDTTRGPKAKPRNRAAGAARDGSEAEPGADFKVELSVHVLTPGQWPTYQPAEVKLPAEVLELQEVFHSFYTGKHIYI